MGFEEKIAELEEQKSQLTKTLKILKIKQAQVLKIKQLADDITKLNSDISIIQNEVKEEEKK